MPKKTCCGVLFAVLVSALLIAGISFNATEGVAYAQDNVPPTTSHDYDGAWRTSDFTINLTATDSSGISETYYRINGGPIQNISRDSKPRITIENRNNTLEYWSVDNAGNQETPKMLTDIKLDKTVPIGSITINDGATLTTSTQVKLTIIAQDATSGVAQMRFFDYIYGDWEQYAIFKLWTFKPGEAYKTVYVQFKDNAGLVSAAYPASIYFGSNPPSYVPLEQAPSAEIPEKIPEKPAEKPTETIAPIEDAPTPTPTPPLPFKADMSFVPTTIGIVIAIAILGIIMVHAFKKRL